MMQRSVLVLVACLAVAPGCGARTISDLLPAGESGAASSGSGAGGAAAASTGAGAGGAASTGAGAGGSGDCGVIDGPSLLASDEVGPFDIVADDTHAYWANESTSTVSRVSLCTGAVTQIATGELSPFAIAVDATHVYWSNLPVTGGLRRAPLDGGKPVTLWSGGQIEGVAVNAGAVYWTVVATPDPSQVGIWTMSKGGGPASQLYSGQVERSVAADDDSVYFGAGIMGESVLAKVKITGGPPVMLAPIWVLGAIALDATDVYVATWESTANVVRVAKAGGPMTVIEGPTGGPNTGVAVAGGRVAWTHETPGDVVWAPVGGGAPVTIATGQPTPERIAAGGGWLVWANYNGGSIWRAPVP